jgi:FixJ family two-component response regulator
MTADDPVVYVVDDDSSVREAIASLLASVGLRAETYATAQEFLKRARPETPGCLVLDVRLPGSSGLDLQNELARSEAPMPIVFISGHGDVPMTVQAMKAGARDFLTKPFRDQELLDAVQLAIEGDRVSFERRSEMRDLRGRYKSLSPREREVLSGVVTGLLNKQIAAEIGTSEITVKAHRANVMKKMRAESLAELVRLAARLGDPTPEHNPTDTNV